MFQSNGKSTLSQEQLLHIWSLILNYEKIFNLGSKSIKKLTMPNDFNIQSKLKNSFPNENNLKIGTKPKVQFVFQKIIKFYLFLKKVKE